ncbi:type 1 glutamine amidotransferase-like domain-containing protein, partial [Candidatus Roizmanbacteria bacterium]|nr:type 1 glutamine amidotransferase-like domain-containing protein [Candidatus Roizmanbacteria bacterium]
NEACAVENSNDNSFFVDGMHFIKHNFGDFYLVNLLALSIDDIKKRIEKSDAIFCFGGNTEYLKTVFDKTGLSTLLPELLKTKVWCGSSAGSMVLGKMISSKWQGNLYGDFDDYGINNYVDLLDFSILPHLKGGDLASDNKDKVVFDISLDTDWDIYALSDWSAVLIDGDKVQTIGKHWSKLRDGKILENNR